MEGRKRLLPDYTAEGEWIYRAALKKCFLMIKMMGVSRRSSRKSRVRIRRNHHADETRGRGKRAMSFHALGSEVPPLKVRCSPRPGRAKSSRMDTAHPEVFFHTELLKADGFIHLLENGSASLGGDLQERIHVVEESRSAGATGRQSKRARTAGPCAKPNGPLRQLGRRITPSWFGFHPPPCTSLSS